MLMCFACTVRSTCNRLLALCIQSVTVDTTQSPQLVEEGSHLCNFSWGSRLVLCRVLQRTIGMKIGVNLADILGKE